MIFPSKYKCLSDNIFSSQEYSIVPIRFEDRLDIMKWRNEQVYHLRQENILTEKDQNNYFKNTVSKLFDEEKPTQILFSFLKNKKCIGYGGLVHINWIDKSAEVSFIMETTLEKKYFEKYWSIYLNLLEQIAFKELEINSIYTYAYNLRPKLYPMLLNNGFVLKEILQNQILVDNKEIDVYIHQKNKISIRNAEKSDVNILFEWANDKLVREQSFKSEKIKLEEHIKWFNSKFLDKNSIFYILEDYKTPYSLIRFDINDKNSTIGILIDKKYRGKGMAVQSLILGCKKYFSNNQKEIFAYIKKINISSIKSFERAGFVFFKEIEIDKQPSFIYKLKDN